MYDVIIIGGGPGGAAGAVYAARKKLKTLVVTESFGGQSMVSDNIENWIGTKVINGLDLAKMLEEHVRAQEDVEVRMPELVKEVKESPNSGFEVITDQGSYQSKAILVTSGGRRRKLGIPGEAKFEGRGVAFCATCDAPLFKGKRVAVIGGGNAGLEAVVDLFPYASEIYLVHRGPELKGDPSTQEEIKKNPLVEMVLNAETQEVLGDKFVTGLKYKDKNSGEVRELVVDGIFVEVGSIPNSDFVKGLVELNQFGEIVIDHVNGKTSKLGIWAAGDVTTDPYKQNNISAGDAVKAALSIYEYILKMKKTSPASEVVHLNGRS